MHRLAMLPLAAAAALAIGCGESGVAESAIGDSAPLRVAAAVTKQEQSPRTGGAKGVRIRIVDSRYGRVVANGRGEALYLFAKERAGKAECYGACAKAWPPVLTRGKPVAGAGARGRLLGTTRRASGKLQVTYAGHPLYFYVGDSPGHILCQGVEEFGGDWLVVKPSGSAVR